jgi:hypothetical protein
MLLLRQIDEGLGISRSLARCFYDARNPLFIEHSVRELVPLCRPIFFYFL